jgi:hypothetical protein
MMLGRFWAEDRTKGKWPPADIVAGVHSIGEGEFCICCETLDEHATCYYRLGPYEGLLAFEVISGLLFVSYLEAGRMNNLRRCSRL